MGATPTEATKRRFSAMHNHPTYIVADGPELRFARKRTSLKPVATSDFGVTIALYTVTRWARQTTRL